MRVLTLAVITLALGNVCSAAVEGVVETFTGDGQFNGFDNPGWSVVGDGEFSDGGFAVQNFDLLDGETDRLARDLFGVGSFVSEVTIMDVYLGDIVVGEDPTGSHGRIALLHRLVPDTGESNHFALSVTETSLSEDGEWSLTTSIPGSQERFSVPSGTDIALSTSYNAVRSEVLFTYDHDITDDLPGMSFGPMSFDGTMTELHETRLFFSAFGSGHSDALLDHWSIQPISDVPGDFNANDVLDVNDLDLLTTESRAETHDTFFDLNNDNLVNGTDRMVWVHDLKQTSFGDANLNGLFDSADLVNVLREGEYDDDVALNSTWATGDWNGDGDFDSGDLVSAFQDGGYVPDAAAIPEPSSLVLMLIGSLVLVRFRS